ncbi:MAG: DUF465 domain-containing protein [Desulfovibrio sp.]
MEANDLALIEQYAEKDTQIKALWDQHREYESLLSTLDGKVTRSETEEQQLKELKKKKLAGKTKLQFLLDKYRETEA